jgi:proteasome lid subunit RPN8/RPN11
MRIELSPEQVESIRRHARAEHPRECCGILLGRRAPGGASVQTVVPAANIAPEPLGSYQVSPPELTQAQRTARELGLEIVGFYHSHPKSAAEFSATDREQAYWPGCFYLVVGVGEECRAYWVGETVEEAELVIAAP